MKYIIITKKIWDKKNFNKINKKIFVLNKIDNVKIKKNAIELYNSSLNCQQFCNIFKDSYLTK